MDSLKLGTSAGRAGYSWAARWRGMRHKRWGVQSKRQGGSCCCRRPGWPWRRWRRTWTRPGSGPWSRSLDGRHFACLAASRNCRERLSYNRRFCRTSPHTPLNITLPPPFPQMRLPLNGEGARLRLPMTMRRRTTSTIRCSRAWAIHNVAIEGDGTIEGNRDRRYGPKPIRL